MSRKQYGLGYYRGLKEGKKKTLLSPYRIETLARKLKEKTTEELLELLEVYAIRMSEGHYSLFRFTSNWRCCLCTVQEAEGELASLGMGPNLWDGISAIPEGRTMKEAIINCIVDAETRGSAY